MPTAGLIPDKSFCVNVEAYSQGGLMTDLSFAPFHNFNFGLSYGGNGIIGTGDIVWQNLPGIQLRYRAFDETLSFPAILIGVNTQGVGPYDVGSKRFQTMSPGLFVAISKSFRWAPGLCGFHGGIGYSFEPKPDDRIINLWFGVDQELGDILSFSLEFNPNLDESGVKYMTKKGLLNAAIRADGGNGFGFSFLTRDLMIHIAGAHSFSRFIGFEITGSI
jgi:hypothetical protein